MANLSSFSRVIIPRGRSNGLVRGGFQVTEVAAAMAVLRSVLMRHRGEDLYLAADAMPGICVPRAVVGEVETYLEIDMGMDAGLCGMGWGGAEWRWRYDVWAVDADYDLIGTDAFFILSGGALSRECADVRIASRFPGMGCHVIITSDVKATLSQWQGSTLVW